MTDIVERLRAGFFLREEAADEIERLRAGLLEAAERLEARGHLFGARCAREIVSDMTKDRKSKAGLT